MLANMVGEGASWQLVAILCTIIIALAGALTHQIGSRFNRQSVKHEDLRKVFYDYMGASRERIARAEGHIADTDNKIVHNLPEIYERLGKVEVGCAECKGKRGGS